MCWKLTWISQMWTIIITLKPLILNCNCIFISQSKMNSKLWVANFTKSMSIKFVFSRPTYNRFVNFSWFVNLQTVHRHPNFAFVCDYLFRIKLIPFRSLSVLRKECFLLLLHVKGLLYEIQVNCIVTILHANILSIWTHVHQYITSQYLMTSFSNAFFI